MDLHPAAAWLAVLHGVQAVHRKIQNDLLQVNLVATHQQGAIELMRIDLNLSFQGFRANDVECFANHLIEIEFQELALASFQFSVRPLQLGFVMQPSD